MNALITVQVGALTLSDTVPQGTPGTMAREVGLTIKCNK